MTSKQRAYLKSLAAPLEATLQIGKLGLTPEVTQAVRELLKITMLKTCLDDIRQTADILSERTSSQVVQVIGRKIVLYKENRDNKKIELP